MRKRAKVDANQAEIVRALRMAGASVHSLASVGGGCPDLLVGAPHPIHGHPVNYLLEIKDGRQPPSKRKLTDDEMDWIDTWRGDVRVVTSVEEALKAVGRI